MKQLTSMDEVWFSLESENTPMHITCVDIFSGRAENSSGISLASLKRHLEKRLDQLPLRQKRKAVPGGLDNSYWVDDEDLDLDSHIEEVKLPKPGGWAQLMECAGELAQKPLDIERPLWQMSLVTGLDALEDYPPGSFALVTKLHHGQFDGGSLMRFFQGLYDHSIEPDVTTTAESRQEMESPSRVKLMSRSLATKVVRPFKMGKPYLKVLSNLPSAITAAKSSEGGTKVKSSATRFYQKIETPERVVESVSFKLQDVQAIRRSVPGATINDVIVALCGGAVRKYLTDHGDEIDGDYTALTPISLRSEEEMEQAGNKVSFVMPTLGLSEQDHIERLRQVSQSTVAAKEMVDKSGSRDTMELFELLPGYVMGGAIGLFRKLEMFDRLPAMYSGVSITNVPGSKTPLYLCGHEMVLQVPVGFLMGSMGVLFAVTSYRDTLSISITSAPHIMSDPELLAEKLRITFGEFAEQAGSGV